MASPLAVRPQITVELRRNGDVLERRYHFPIYGERFASSQPLSDIGAAYTVGSARGLAALHGVLLRGRGPEIDTHLGGSQLDLAGEALFEALLGPDPERWGEILRAAFQEKERSPSPISHPLRVRIWSEDPMLIGLPWRAAMWHRFLLADYGWTFEGCFAPSASGRIEHRSPGRILILAPERPPSGGGEDDIRTEAHLAEIRELLETISRGYTRSDQLIIVQRRDDLEPAIARLQPEVFYFYGHGDAQSGQLLLKIGDRPDDWLLMRDLARILRSAPPKAVFLNACWTAQAGWHAGGFQLHRDVPLVITNATVADAAPARQYALRWLKGWLKDGVDPLTAAHARPAESMRVLDWGIAVVHANFDTWKTEKAPAPPVRAVDRAEEWFDRDRQRSIVFKHVSDLTRDAKQRVEAILAYGKPGNALDRLPQQIIDHIEREAGDRMRIRRYAVRLPPLDGPSLRVDDLEHSLKSQLGHGPTEPLEGVLRAKAPGPTRDTARIVWLDWGVLRGMREHREQVFAWLSFARDRLGRGCPDDLRVVASMALEADGDAFTTLAANLPGLRAKRELRTERFRCTAADPLDSGTLTDILDFLDRHACEGNIQEPLAEAIFAHTAGHYERTMALFRDGFALGWQALLGKLGGAKPLSERW